MSRYPLTTAIQPDWKEGGRGEKKRPKGFWELLRNSRLYIHPPQEIADGIAKLQRKKRTIDVTVSPFSPSQLKQAQP